MAGGIVVASLVDDGDEAACAGDAPFQEGKSAGNIEPSGPSMCRPSASRLMLVRRNVRAVLAAKDSDHAAMPVGMAGHHAAVLDAWITGTLSSFLVFAAQRGRRK